MDRLLSAAADPIFTATTAAYLLVDTALTIRAVNDAYLTATARTRDDTLGCPMFEAFPDDPSDPDAHGVRNLLASYRTVLRTGAVHRMQIQRYNVRPSGPGAAFVPRTWLPVNSPLLDDSGRVFGILHHVEEVTAVAAGHRSTPAQMTELALAAQRYLAGHDALVRENARLRDVLAALGAVAGYARPANDIDRRSRLWRLLTHQSLDGEWRGWPAALCGIAVDLLDTVNAAALTVRDAKGRAPKLAASDRWASELVRLDDAHPGPGTMAYQTGLPVVVEDLRTERRRWPDFVDEALDLGLAAVHIAPLVIDGRSVGTLNLYRRELYPFPARGEQLDAAALADLAVTAVLADIRRVGELVDPTPRRSVAFLARTLATRYGIGEDEALTRIRAHTLFNGQCVEEVEWDLLQDRLRLD